MGIYAVDVWKTFLSQKVKQVYFLFLKCFLPLMSSLVDLLLFSLQTCFTNRKQLIRYDLVLNWPFSNTNSLTNNIMKKINFCAHAHKISLLPQFPFPHIVIVSQKKCKAICLIRKQSDIQEVMKRASVETSTLSRSCILVSEVQHLLIKSISILFDSPAVYHPDCGSS